MANEGIAPPDLTTPVGLVRVLVGDTDPRPIREGEGEYAWYSDDELAALLTVFGQDPRRVAIQVLSMVAISQAMLLKKWSTDDLSVDGPAILSAMEKTIARLAKEVKDDADALSNEDFFDVFTASGSYPHAEGTAYPYVW